MHMKCRSQKPFCCPIKMKIQIYLIAFLCMSYYILFHIQMDIGDCGKGHDKRLGCCNEQNIIFLAFIWAFVCWLAIDCRLQLFGNDLTNVWTREHPKQKLGRKKVKRDFKICTSDCNALALPTLIHHHQRLIYYYYYLFVYCLSCTEIINTRPHASSQILVSV